MRGFRQPVQFLLEALQHQGDVVDRLLHFFVIAFINLRNQFVDLAVGDLREYPVAFPDRQQNRIQHGIHAAHDFGVRALKMFGFAALGELPVLGSLGQTPEFFFERL